MSTDVDKYYSHDKSAQAGVFTQSIFNSGNKN